MKKLIVSRAQRILGIKMLNNFIFFVILCPAGTSGPCKLGPCLHHPLRKLFFVIFYGNAHESPNKKWKKQRLDPFLPKFAFQAITFLRPRTESQKCNWGHPRDQHWPNQVLLILQNDSYLSVCQDYSRKLDFTGSSSCPHPRWGFKLILRSRAMIG